MVVKNVDNEQLANICHEISNKIYESGFCPDVVLGIRSSGSFLAAQIYHDLLLLFDNHSITIGFAALHHKRRNCTKIISCFLKILPYSILDRLRVLSLRFKRRAKQYNGEVIISSEYLDGKKVLVVDDAVDTGNTLAAVLNTLKLNNPTVEVKSAVLTVTMDNPIVLPDFTAYTHNIILRLPWALDAK